MHINLEYDSKAQAAPQSFRDAIQAAANVLQATFTDAITINIEVGYGENPGNGSPEPSGGASAGPATGVLVSYTQVRTWLAQNAASAVQGGVATLPTTSSIQGQSQVAVWHAQERLLGQVSANDASLDGYAGFATNISTSALEGVALHELTHAMGRVTYGPQPDVLDLFRFTGRGVRLFTGALPASASYFSLDGGATDLADFGRTSDDSDFLNSSGRTPNDPFNEFYNASTIQGLTSTDLLEMQSLGFHAAAAPSAGSIAINNVSVTEGNSGTQVATFTVTRSGGTAAFSVNYTTADGTAAVGDNDYVARSGTLSFAAGVNTQTISVTVNGDTRVEPDETFFVNLSGVTNGATISASRGTGTIVDDDTGSTSSQPAQVHANDLTYAGTASGSNHFIDLLNFEASYTDLIQAFGGNQQSMQNWYNANEAREQRVETFDGLDYIASYGDLVNAFASAGSMHAVQDAGATHFIFNGLAEGRTTTFNGLDYIASYSDLVAAFGANSDAGAYHYIENGRREGRTTTFDGLDYIAKYSDLMMAFGANEQAGAAHYIVNGLHEGRTTTFDVAGYEQAHPDLVGQYASNDAFLTAYINTYRLTGQLLT
ncbi:MAG: serralysin [Methylobacteriaceae bacterium]|jgi:hypothetical protein|nr:serralysin [Methylobacteriaceae bacterium]